MPEFIYTENFKTPYGELILGSFEEKLCLCDWKYRKQRQQIDQRILKFLNAEIKEETSQIIKTTKAQLKAYFNKERTEFDIPLLFPGTTFQQQVWKSLLQIPYGKTSSYLELSKQLQNIKAIRAVASANSANALSIIVPCHRIIGSNVELVGYAGGLSTKKKLLELEGAFRQNQLELF